MRRDHGLDILGSRFDQNFVEFIGCDLVISAKRCLQQWNISDDVAAFCTTLTLMVHPQSDDLGVGARRPIDISVLVGIGHSLQVVEIQSWHTLQERCRQTRVKGSC